MARTAKVKPEWRRPKGPYPPSGRFVEVQLDNGIETVKIRRTACRSIIVTKSEWLRFVAAVKNGEYDDLA